jgi:OOP family OmpA-OmpF porin
MHTITPRSRLLAAVLTLGTLAGCADWTPPPKQEMSSAAPAGEMADAPVLAGAWYQIYFDTNSAEINARGKLIVETVSYVVANVGADSVARVTVIGKTDRVGAPPANLALSKVRAEKIRDSLIAAGVPSDRIDTTWTGEAKQMVATGNHVTEARNRVVDVTVIKEPR